MPTHILMNVVDEQELRVGVIRDGRLDTLLHERIGDGQHLGNIYKARVANVEPSLDAAFLDLGAGKNGFIHIDEVQHDKGANARIEHVLQSGQEIVVQITKEAIKDKGPCVSTYLSLPGRYLVLMSATQIKGVSKRIEDQAVRKRLKGLLATFEPPEGFGFIVRTAGADRQDDEIRLDYEFLKRLWSEVSERTSRVRAPACLYQEADVVVRTLRDLGASDVEAIIIDQEKLFDEARAFAQVFMPELCNKIQLHREALPLFSYYGIEERIAGISDRKVQLPSGGTIVIEQTEALVSIDVNSARNRGSGDVESTALMTNLEAISAIAEQLILRDLGGLIIIDFIDMESREHQRLVQLGLRRALSHDKAKIQVSSLSRFGLLEMTRQRTRPSHKLLASAECPYCVGVGSIKTPETFEIDCMRSVREALSGKSLSRLEVVVPQDMAITILNARHHELAGLEAQHDCRVVFTGDTLMKAREFRLIPTARKGERGRDRGREQPVRPSLLAPLMVERAKAMALARELAAMKPDQLERELEEGEVRKLVRVEDESAPVAAPLAVRGPASIWDEADVLRRLLFSPNRPVTVAPAPRPPELAQPGRPASMPGRHSGGRRRRR
ncbi:MAG: Rne/Rng family ribonuclease [Planctomycetes bacterium]|nr:Rne/Rng family ribonuclease [Planctomycetota bacterium]